MIRLESNRQRRERIMIAMIQSVMSSDVVMAGITDAVVRKDMSRCDMIVGVAAIYTDTLIEELDK